MQPVPALAQRHELLPIRLRDISSTRLLIGMLPASVEASIPTKQAVPASVGLKALVPRESARTGTHETMTEDIQKGIIAA